MKAFEVRANGKVLDYRLGKDLDLEEVGKFFRKNYNVKKIWQEKRHVVGILEKNNVHYFLKLAPTEGISVVTQIEADWNDEFNKLVARTTEFWVPNNFDRGFYKQGLFYLITDYFEGELLAKRPTPEKIEQILIEDLPKIIEFGELIQNLNLTIQGLSQRENESFLDRTKSWFNEVPQKVVKEYGVGSLLNLVENNYLKLAKKPRHGDFTPWHMFRLKNNKLGLIDGEHAMKNGVQYYDLGYLIQRVYSVMKNPAFAQTILEELLKIGYDLEKLKVVLAARAIGGFCDETLIRKEHDYERANKFKEWVLAL